MIRQQVMPKEPVRVAGLPIIGNMPDLAGDALKFVSGLQQKHGDVVAFSLMGNNMVLISNPADIERVLLETGKRYNKFDPPYSLRMVLGNGLVSSEGDLWKRQRKLVAPPFHHESIKRYADLMVAYTQDMLGTWHYGAVRDIHEEMMLLTQRIIMKALFGVDVLDNAGAAGEAFDAMMQGIGAEMTGLDAILPSFVPTPSRSRVVKAVSYINEMLLDIVQKRQAEGSTNADLLDVLMSARDEEGQPMSKEQMLDEIRTLYLAGHETTATMLSWTWLLLSRNPSVYAKVEAEVDEVLNGRLPTADDVQRLPYCSAVIKEALRCYPVAWVFQRTALEDVEIGGFKIAKGTMLWISPWVVHHDERWYPQPNDFVPERWLKDKAEQPPREAYLPFGGGPRICIGNGFAMMEGALLLAAISQWYHVAVLPDHPVEVEMTGTIRPKFGLKAVVTER